MSEQQQATSGQPSPYTDHAPYTDHQPYDYDVLPSAPDQSDEEG